MRIVETLIGLCVEQGSPSLRFQYAFTICAFAHGLQTLNRMLIAESFHCIVCAVRNVDHVGSMASVADNVAPQSFPMSSLGASSAANGAVGMMWETQRRRQQRRQRQQRRRLRRRRRRQATHTTHTTGGSTNQSNFIRIQELPVCLLRPIESQPLGNFLIVFILH